MVKKITKTTRGKTTRERKKIIVVGTEGNNKTEELYLRELEKKQCQYHFLFAPGNETDPVKIVRNTIKKVKDEELSFKDGDLAISIFDLDMDRAKEDQLNQAKALSQAKSIGLVTSNPCFEIWYLEHFGYTSKPFSNSAELIKELKKHLSEYNKSKSYFEILYPLTKEAVKNCALLDKHHTLSGPEGLSEFNNPRTDVYKLVEIILAERGDV